MISLLWYPSKRCCNRNRVYISVKECAACMNISRNHGAGHNLKQLVFIVQYKAIINFTKQPGLDCLHHSFWTNFTNPDAGLQVLDSSSIICIFSVLCMCG